MIGGEDRGTVFNAEHGQLDRIYVVSDVGVARNNLVMSVEL